MLSHIENLAQNWDFWPFLTCEGWNLAKSRNVELLWKFGSKLRFLTTLDLQRMKFEKNQESWHVLQIKLGSKFRFLIIPDLRRMKLGKIQKCWVVLKIWLKIEILDYTRFEIWQNPEILTHIERAQNWDFDHSGPGKDKIWQNPETFSCVENLAQNLDL